MPPAFAQLLAFFKALGDESRLRIVGVLAQRREASVGELADVLALREPTVSHHLARLRELGLVTVRREGTARYYALDISALQQIGREVFSAEGLEVMSTGVDADAWRTKVLRTFVDGETITKIPASHKKRIVILEWLLERFERDRRYPEKELNALILQSHPDSASLRRELVGRGYMRREHGVYWRVDG